MGLGTRQFLQDNNVPPSRILSFNVNSFNGGLNNVNEIQNNEAFNIMNMAFTDGVYMEKRTGITDSKLINQINAIDELVDITGDDLFDSLSSPLVLHSSTEINFCDEYRPYVGEHILLVGTNDYLYKVINGEYYIISSVQGKVRGVNYFGKYYFVDGFALKVFDGLSVKQVISPPQGYVPAPSPAKAGVINSNATQIWYEPCALQIQDVNLGANVVPNNPEFIDIRKNRLYISGCNGVDNNTVYITDIENALYFAVLLPLQPTPNGEKITGLKNFQDVMIVAREESIFAIYGNTNISTSDDVFYVKRINTHTGVASQDSMHIMNNFLAFLGSDGVVYRMQTPLTDVRQVMTDILSKKIDLALPPLSFNPSDYKNATGCFSDGEYVLKIGDRILIYNYRHMAWTVYNNIETNHIFVMNSVRYYCGLYGQIFRHKTYDTSITETDPQWKIDETLTAFSDGDGVGRQPISAFYKTKRDDMGMPSYFKFFRDLYVTAKIYLFLKSTTKITFELDYQDVEGQFKSSFSTSVFGISKFGDMFINKEIVDSLPIRLGRRARTIALNIYNDYLDEPMRIIEINGDYTLRGRR